MKLTLEVEVDWSVCECLVREEGRPDKLLTAVTLPQLVEAVRKYVERRLEQEGLPE